MKKNVRSIASKKHAGSLLTSLVPVVEKSAAIADIERLLIKRAKDFETINYIYVVDSEKRLLGAVSIKDIFRTDKKVGVLKLLPKKTISVHERTDGERVAYLALKHSIKAIPVVDREGRFLGAVPSDVILKVLDSAAVEDLLRFGGVMHFGKFDDVLHISLLSSLKRRMPWLAMGLIGGVLASAIVGTFEDVLSRNLILAAFIPLIVYMADAVGTQMEAFIIRDLAVNTDFKFFKYFLRQCSIVLLMGALLSGLFYGGALLFYGNAMISFVIAAALFIAIFSSLLTGLIVPFLFSKLKLDPANASGPIATIIQDILSVFIYFAIASLIL
ncbi:magnesium transporter [Patescibacteria group bacterium]|nr:magnesium transporter [Patescibacteria group bacterium]MBU1703644.1 magnesium transporter [Patescibacteria group bacterium]MBU1954249.1 magnesium transporter [Patescibacteria group bacterium]